MKRLVQLQFLFVVLVFALVGCSEGEGDTGESGGVNSAPLGALEETELIKTGSSVTSTQVTIDNATSMINFGSYPIGDSSDKSILLTIFNNSSSELTIITTDIFLVSCNQSVGCIFKSENTLVLQPNSTSTIQIFAIRARDDNREGDIIRNIRFDRDGRSVALMNIKFVSLPRG